MDGKYGKRRKTHFRFIKIKLIGFNQQLLLSHKNTILFFHFALNLFFSLLDEAFLVIRIVLFKYVLYYQLKLGVNAK